MIPDPQTRRDAARTRKQCQRDRDRTNRRASAEAQAARQEALDEHLSPYVLRNPIEALAGSLKVMLMGPRVMIVNGRACRADPIARSRAFSEAHKQAVLDLQRDWSDVGAGVNVAAVDYMRSAGGGSPDGPHRAILEQVHAYARLTGAIASLEAFAPAIMRVVLDGIPIAVWINEPDASGVVRTLSEGLAWIGMGLDRLVAFYHPPIPRRSGIRTMGPHRKDYTTETDDE